MESNRRDVIVAVALSAALVGAMEGMYRPRGSEARVRGRLAELSSDLNLTPAQAREIEEILREEADAEAALAAGSTGDGRDDPRARRRALQDRIAAVLTEEQRERLRQLRAERGRRRPGPL
jgi:Spy/CpxP family protein refolding chaperone